MDRSTHNFRLSFRLSSRLVFRFSALSLLAIALVGCGGTTVVATDEYPNPLLDKYPYSAGIVISAEFASQVYREANKERGVKSVNLGPAQTAILRNVLGAMFTGFEDYETRPESLDVDLLFEPRLEDFQYALPSETSVEVLEVWAKYAIRISDRSGREITDWAVTAYGKTDQRFMASRGAIFGDAVRVAVRDLGANMILGCQEMMVLNPGLMIRARVGGSMIRAVKSPLLMGLCLLIVACSTVKVEENRIETTVLDSSEAIVVLGRRHASSYNTEYDLVSCVASNVGRNGARVIGEADLSDQLYPWLEPRIAPIKIEAMLYMMNRPKVRERLDAMNLRYVVWVDGSTETTDQSGSVSCAIAPGFAGCYGMGVWTNESGYEVSIWDIEDMREISQILVNAEGTSYLPAIVVPIPIIARVQSSACNAIAKQVSAYFRGETGETPN